MYSLTNTLLELQNVDLGYSKDNPILKSISFTERNVVRNDFEATGQIIAILGRSGRGKSTLFKGLTGLLKPTQGSILIKDLNITDNDVAKPIDVGDIGLVSQISLFYV
jgi:polar amino acid transport system ATP-binding protein